MRQPLVCAGAAWLALTAKLVSHFSADPDLFARVAVGRIVAERGTVARVDPFSYTAAGAPWIDHEWLSGAVFYALTQLGGDAALFTFKLGLLAVFLLLLAHASYVNDPARSLSSFLCTTFFTYYVWYSTVRCQVFTYLFLSAYFLIFTLSRQRVTPIASTLLVLVMLFWCNLHGGFVLGLLFLALFASLRAIEDRCEGAKLLAVLVASASVTLINPYGWSYWSYMVRALLLKREFIAEWDPISLSSPVGILLTLLLLLDLPRLAFDYRKNALAIVFLCVSYILALSHLRLAAVFLMVSAVWGAPLALLDELARVRRLPSIVATIELFCYAGSIVCGAYAFRALLQNRPFRLDYGAFPVEAADFLAQSGRSGRLLCSLNEGSFLLWRLYPRFRVSLDGRYEEVYDTGTVDRVRCAFDASCARRSKIEPESRGGEPLLLTPDYVLLALGSSDSSLVKEQFGPMQEIYRDNRWKVLEIGTHEPQSVHAESNKADDSSETMWVPTWTVTDEMFQ